MKFGVYVEVDEWCMMYDDMQYDPIQGQCQGHEPLKSEIRPFSLAISSPFIMEASKWPLIFKLGHNTYSLSGPDFWFLS